MSSWRLVLASLLHHRRASAAIAAGVAVATAVLTGALLVGDSVRGSLRHMVIDRLGRVDQALVTDRFFRAELATELATSPEFPREFTAALPAIMLQATVEAPGSGRRANQVHVIGADERIWALHSDQPAQRLNGDQIALNESLARELGVDVGDSVILRIPAAAEIPPDSPLGRKTETVRNRRLTVSAIVPMHGLGQFSLRPNQQSPLNAFVAPITIQQPLEQRDRVNAMLVFDSDVQHAAPSEAADKLELALAPQLTDFGLAIEETPQGYFNLTSQRMLLDDALVDSAVRAFPSAQVALTYLANTIAAGEREIPYSTVTAINPVSAAPLGPLETIDGTALTHIADDEIVLNDWAADRLGARPGDSIRLVYFRPDSAHGRTEEAEVELRLAAIVKLAGAAADRHFTPDVKGITDERSIADWDPPFQFDPRRVGSADEAYWDQHRGTPKAFVSLSTGRRLWGSRFGSATTVRIPPTSPTDTSQTIADRIQIDPVELGFAFQPVKQQGLQAAVGTTPFQWLFLGFSMFLIAAALMLVALLFRLSVETRAAEVGVLLAVGCNARQVRRIWLLEGVLLSLGGGLAGVGLGIAYAWLMTVGLNRWWVAAVASPFVRLFIAPSSLAIGLTSGVLTACLMIAASLRRLRRAEVRRLLAGEFAAADEPHTTGAKWPRLLAVICLALAVLLALLGARLSAEAQAGAFMGSGALVLVGLILLLGNRLRRTESVHLLGFAAPARLAVRNTARHRGRTLLAVGLVAAAVYLIVAISAFRLEPPREATDRTTGTGGFTLVAESDQPIYENMADALADRGTNAEQQLLGETHIVPARLRAGDDASCLNLYQAQQPRLLGVPQEFIDRGGFAWSDSLAQSAAERENPWRLLDNDYGQMPDGRPIVPVVIDAATAQYSLHLRGVGAMYELSRHPTTGDSQDTVPCLVVGLLKNSMLQGSLITSEARLLRQFPETTGYQFFFVDAPPVNAQLIETALERVFGDSGLDAQSATERLASYLVVQNTYLSTFQSLGGLGLLLGTLGLAVVELRNVFERRAELALMRAVGFRRRWLGTLVMAENLALLAFGMAIGLAAALIAVAPHIARRDAAVPWGSLTVMLGLIALVGAVAGLAAVRSAMRAPVIAALRGD